MNILHVNLAKGFRGGERQTLLLIEQLSTLGHQQALVCRPDSPLRQHLSKVDNLRFINGSHQLSAHMNRFKADIAHAHEARAVHWVYLHKLLRNTPYVITRRVDVPVKNKLFNRLNYRTASARVAISSKIAALLNQLDCGAVEQIPSAFAHLPKNDSVIEAFKKDYPNKFLIGHAGALVDKHKGQLVLIEAARILQERYPQFQFIFLGNGSDEALLKEASKDLSNVSWLGFKDNIADYLRGLDLFAFPSRNEGLGSTLLDVIDCGVPIVASDAGGIPDIIQHQKTGLLVPVNDSVALANALEQLYNDVELRQKLIHNANRHVKDFAPELMAKRYDALYKIIKHSR